MTVVLVKRMHSPSLENTSAWPFVRMEKKDAGNVQGWKTKMEDICFYCKKEITNPDDFCLIGVKKYYHRSCRKCYNKIRIEKEQK